MAFVAAVCAASMATASAPLVVIRPADETTGDARFRYSWSLLEQALKATADDYGPYELKPSAQRLNEQRTLLGMEAGTSDVDILVHGNVAEYETRLLPIRFPLDKGLLGYRVFLIRADMQPVFDRVGSLDDLRRYSIGQGRHWGDIDILRNAGLSVVEGGGYGGLFKMLAAHRFDLFSRSVIEVGEELAKYQTTPPTLAIERHLLLHYPLTRYFYVRRSPQGEQLAARVIAGLERIRRNGRFDDIFAWYLAQIEKPIGLRQRLLIDIDNPLQTPETPVGDTALWYNPVRP